MTVSLKDKLAKLSPETRGKIAERSKELKSQYAELKALRKAKAKTQAELAESMGVSQAMVARFENQPDFLVSTLSRYAKSLGGELDIQIKFPDSEPVRINPELEPA